MGGRGELQPFQAQLALSQGPDTQTVWEGWSGWGRRPHHGLRHQIPETAEAPRVRGPEFQNPGVLSSRSQEQGFQSSIHLLCDFEQVT